MCINKIMGRSTFKTDIKKLCKIYATILTLVVLQGIKEEVVREIKDTQTPDDGEGQGSLVCCSPKGCKESDTT